MNRSDGIQCDDSLLSMDFRLFCVTPCDCHIALQSDLKLVHVVMIQKCGRARVIIVLCIFIRSLFNDDDGVHLSVFSFPLFDYAFSTTDTCCCWRLLFNHLPQNSLSICAIAANINAIRCLLMKAIIFRNNNETS